MGTLQSPACQNKKKNYTPKSVLDKIIYSDFRNVSPGVQFEGDSGEISPYIGLREKWESP